MLAAISSHLAEPLGTALVIYEECLIEHLIKFTFELLRVFHFSFHNIDGIDQPIRVLYIRLRFKGVIMFKTANIGALSAL